jgi:hypothetical protein
MAAGLSPGLCCEAAEEADDCPPALAAAGLVRSVRPWNAWAAASDTNPVTATAAATSHRLIREIKSRPAFRVAAAPEDIASTVIDERTKPSLKTR